MQHRESFRPDFKLIIKPQTINKNSINIAYKQHIKQAIKGNSVRRKIYSTKAVTGWETEAPCTDGRSCLA
jgi:hypothetical protein